MKLPKIECVVEEKYYKNDKFVLPRYKVKRGTFDWSDPFQMAPHLSICPNRAPWEFDEVKDFSFSPQTYGADYKHEDKEVEWLFRQLNTEMKLMCEQVECFLKEYSSPDGLEWMCKDVVEGLVGYALTSYEMGKTLGPYLGVTAIEFSHAYKQFIPDFSDWCYMKFSFLFKEDADLRDFYAELANKRLPKKEVKEEAKLQIMSEDDMVAEAHRMLGFLNGVYEGYRFLTEEDYVKLVEWVEVLIREKRIAEDVHKIELQKRMTEKGMKQWDKHFLSYTIRKIHNVCFKNTNARWKTFLSMITGWKESSITAHFSKCPDDYDEIVKGCVN